MEKDHGYGIIAWLLREKLGIPAPSSWHVPSRSTIIFKNTQEKDEMALRLLKAVLSFVGYNDQHPDRSLLVNPMAYRVFLVDFDTWRVATLRSQKLYYQQLVDFLKSNSNSSFNAKRFGRMRK